MLVTPSLSHCSNKYKLAREGEKDKGKDYVMFFLFLGWSQVVPKEMSFQLLLEDWQGSSIPDRGGLQDAIENVHHYCQKSEFSTLYKNLPYSRACVQTIWGKLSLLEHVLFSDTDSRQISFSKIRNAMLYFKINSSLLQYIWIFNNYETQKQFMNRNWWKSNQPKWLLIWPRLIQLMTL